MHSSADSSAQSPTAASAQRRTASPAARWAYELGRVVLAVSVAFGVSSGVSAGAGCVCDDALFAIDDDKDDDGAGQVCDLDVNCKGNKVLRMGKCVASGCESDTDCCPGTRCRTDFNTCWPLLLDNQYACETDSDCADPAQRCKMTTVGERDPLPTCVYETCNGDVDCGSGRTCFVGYCVATAPCGGGCPSGEVCDIISGQCSVVPKKASGCSQECTAGVLVLAVPEGMSGETCCEPVCECRGLPPIVPTRYGKYASVAATPGQLMVSSYDSTYGDLVVTFHKLDGGFSRITYVDGIPLGAPVVADSGGPRRGIAAPGPNVGTHTSIAVNSVGRGRVAYHDVDNGALKVAIEDGSGWVTHVVDQPPEGRAGLFTDIAVDSESGLLTVAYLVTDVPGAPGVAGKASALKVARSLTPTPASEADWDRLWVDVREAFDPCDGECNGIEACVLDGEAVCRTVATGCSGCTSSQTCVDLPVAADAGPGEDKGCLPPPLPEPPADRPRARGLHPSLVLDGADAVVAYHDSIDGSLRAARVDASGTATLSVLDGADGEGHHPGTVGLFPAAQLVDGELWVAYMDASAHHIRLWRGADIDAVGAFSVVDDGDRETDPGLRFVGGGAAFGVLDGNPLLVYQNASDLDLQVAELSGSAWSRETLLSSGGAGFFTDMVVQDDRAYIVHVSAALDDRGEEAIALGLIVRTAQ